MTNNDPLILTTKLEENLFHLRERFVHSEDFIMEYLHLQGKESYLVYIETIIDKKLVQKRVLEPLKESGISNNDEKQALSLVKESNSIKELTQRLLEGCCIVLSQNSDLAYIFEVPVFSERPIKEPETEGIIRGAHDGFVESLSTNISLIRKRIHNPKLKVKYIYVGNDSHTKIGLIYLDHIANKKTVSLIEQKLSEINMDIVLAPGYIEEFVSNNTSIFPTMLSTERPDRIVANLMDGRIAIMSDSSPGALIAPTTFFTFYQSPDDYNSRWYYGSFIRFIRIMGFLISIALPALYIAIVSFHFEVLPTEIVFSIKTSLENVPYPPLIEALGMQITLEILREASIRLPSRIAQTIGVVGGLVIGTAVVEANLVSNTMIIVVAITAISSFIVPITEMGSAIRLLGFPFMFMAAMFGLIGMSFFFMFLLIHLCKLESFGTPYFAPLSTLRWSEMKDTLIRVPFPLFKTRPNDTMPQKKNKKVT
ncbi:spore germination protein [Bacillus sp. CHD6a]|uniref:spore germination protein n=1 Tax=Bacillus sp. CHD6a TaxID=1643452 RepID=UPI0006CDDBAE|nr:spore germination protein [Bacillus sp. CHD6a]KPB04037.1 hypothetical protein AAV98_14450 [Bacillus sp. CHD6a]